MVFNRSQARAVGWSDSAISRAVRAGRLIAVRPGWFARPDAGEVVAATAAVYAHPGLVISHRTAATMHGIPVVGGRPPVPEVTIRPRGTSNTVAVHVHRATLGAGEVVLLDGCPATSVARTVIDLARSRRIECGVAAIDYVLHEGLATTSELEQILARCSNWPGIKRARKALELSDARAESALESVSRLVIRWLHLPMPELQVLVCDRTDFLAGRLDFYREEFGVAGEADGKGKYLLEENARDREKTRQENLEDDGLAFARWGWKEAWRDRPVIASKVLNAFERGRARDSAGFPRFWSVVRRPTGQDRVKATDQDGR
jgi:hypothetical protein